MRKTKSEEMFDSLVSNAIDFLKHSVAELQESPKYSVINFCSAIEIFLKARLMLEHWSLIVTKPENANLVKFSNGDFQSVGVDEAINRLSNIASEDFTKEEKKCFEQIRYHRNKLVHFFHSKYVSEPDSNTLSDVVAEQCKGWFYLYRLLTEKWKRQFAKHLKDLESLNAQMHQRREFLRAKYEALLPELNKEKEAGVIFSRCLSCGFESGREEIVFEPLIAVECKVCGLSSRLLRVPCPKCGDSINVYDLGVGECENCETTIDMDYLTKKYAEQEYLGEGLYTEDRAYCSDCEYTDQESVIAIGDKWLCLSCLNTHYTAQYCEWCGEFIAGELEGSYVAGCVMCEGLIGHSD